jgi:hypothetical protein
MDEIVIVMEDGRNPPRFRLGHENAPPRVVGAVIVDPSAEEPLWLLAPASFSTELPYTVVEATPQEVATLADEEMLDPIEDLAPSDPRHQEALASRASMVESTPILASLTYGVVPSGFRQASPRGPVAALLPGKPYHLMVIGPSGHGTLAFQVE